MSETTARVRRRSNPRSSEPWYKTREYAIIRNKKRRERYMTDEEYRLKQIERSREKYREEVGGLSIENEQCKNNLKNFESFGQVRPVYGPLGKYMGERHCFTVEEFADLLGRKVQTLYRWLNKEVVPAPVFGSTPVHTSQRLYLAEEVKEMAEVLVAHFEVTPYLRKDHDVTREELLKTAYHSRRLMGL